MELSDEQIALNGFWQEKRYGLVELTESLSSQVARDQRFIIWDYVDHNELAIAFDHLLYVLFDEPATPTTISQEQAGQILALGKALSYTAQSDIVYKIFLTRYFPDEPGTTERE